MSMMPNVVTRGSHGWSTTRLDNYDLTDEQWRVYVGDHGMASIAASVSPDQTILTLVMSLPNGISFNTFEKGNVHDRLCSEVREAIRHHEEWAKTITARVEAMEGFPVLPVRDGVL